MSKWIEFIEVRPNPKTRRWRVAPKDSVPGYAIGVVQWYAPWRKYCFFPFGDMVFEQDCLRDIAVFIEEQTDLHKTGKTLLAGGPHGM